MTRILTPLCLAAVCLLGCTDESEQVSFEPTVKVYSCENRVIITDQISESTVIVSVYNDKELKFARQLTRQDDRFSAEGIELTFQDSGLTVINGTEQIGPCFPDSLEAERRQTSDTCYYITESGNLIRTLTTNDEGLHVWMSSGRYVMLDTILPRVVSASGEKYEQGDVLFWSKGYTAIMVHNGVMHGHCVRMWPDEVRDKGACSDTTIMGMVSSSLGNELDLLEPKDRKFAAEWIDLNGDGENELAVMLLSPYFCGSGGCTWYILNGDGSVLTRGTIAGYPFYVGEPGDEGYRTLYIRSGGAFRTMEFQH